VADVVQLKADAGRTKWEFHYAFPDTAVRYVVRPSGFEGELFCRLTVKATNGDTTVDEWTALATATSSRPEHRQFYTGARQIILKPGRAQVDLLVRDMNDTSRVLRTSFATTVREFGLTPDMSDIIFTTPEAGVTSQFMRNGVQVVPNPRHEMVGRDPSISIYGEVYNAKVNDLDTFVVEYLIQDAVRNEMLTTYRRMVAVDDALLYREDIPAGLLRSGVYNLTVSMRSMDLTTTYAARDERFYILNPELPPEGQVLITEEERFFASEWAVKTGDALELELELAQVLAIGAEKTIMEDLETERAKQRFLYKFWGVRDPDPSTEANERLDEFRKMYQRAQAFYSGAMVRDGWRTDRGVTLLKYGRPTQVEQFIQTIDTRPYEIWFYQNVQGGAYFYFVDWQVMQNHKLVHSTVIGEVKDEKWFDRWARAFSPDPNPVHELLPNNR